MYDTGDHLPVDELPAGVVLCTGPPMVGKRDLLLGLLAQGLDGDEGVVAVSTDRTASELDAELAAFRADPDATAPIGYVDASGNSEESVPELPVETVGSPADLTGIGVGLSNHLDRLARGGNVGGVRVGLLSLSTLLLYSEPVRILRYLHAFAQRIDETGALAFVSVHDESLEGEMAGQVRSFVDGAIELQEDNDGHRVRLRGLPGSDTDWHSIGDPRVEQTAQQQPPETVPKSTIESLRALIDAVRADRPTLTIGNYTGGETTLNRIESYFQQLQVGVRTTDLGFSSPTDVAMLHRGDDLLSTARVTEVDAAVAVDTDEFGVDSAATTPLLDAVDQTTFDAVGADRRFLVQVSHTIETLATRDGSGRIHAGFQAFSRLAEDDRARGIYESLVRAGLDVHVYGAPDADLPDREWTVHTAENDDELRQTWFVCYRSSDDDTTEGTLVAEEHDDRYDGFWSYRSDLAEQLDTYLQATH